MDKSLMRLLPSTPLVLLLSFLVTGTHSTPQSLTLLTATSCLCPGHQLVYECTVVGPAIQYTVWRGSALFRDCRGSIALLHGQFMDTGYANGTCNGGDIFARITSYTGDCFTSQLIVNTSMELNGKAIECAIDNGRDRTTVNASTIRIITAPFPPPTDVRLIDAQPGQITLNWTSVISDALCDSLIYNIISFNCGTCPSTTANTSVTCTNIVASGQVCTFTVQAVVCGSLTGNESSPKSVIMKAPRVLTVNSVPRFEYVTGSLLSINTVFDALDSVSVSDGFDIHVAFYNISYKDSSTGNICGQIVTIPSASCVANGPLRMCRHVFEVSSSFCHPSTNITVIISAISMFGAGESDPVTVGSRNQFFDADFTFDFDTLTMTIACIFLDTINSKASSEQSCAVQFGLGHDVGICENFSWSQRSIKQKANISRISVDQPIFLTNLILSSDKDMCLVIRANDGRHIAEVERRLTIISGCDKNHLSDGTVLSDGVRCGLPLLTASIKNGIVCYTGTGIGAIATHHCFNNYCHLTLTSSAHPVRTCLPNGTWNGTVPLCHCSTINSTAISLGVVIVLLATVLIVTTVLLITSRLKIFRMLKEIKSKDNIPIYDDIDISNVIDPKKNVAYEAPSQLGASKQQIDQLM